MMNERRFHIPKYVRAAVVAGIWVVSGLAAADDRWYVSASGGFTSNPVSTLDFDSDGLEGPASADAERGGLGGRIAADYSVFEVTADISWRF